MDYLFDFGFIPLFLILLFAIWLISQRTPRDRQLRYFWLTVISCFLLVVEDPLESFTALNPDLRFWRILLSVAGYTLRSTAIAGLVIVVCRPEHRNRMIWWIPCILNFVICSTAFFSDVVFGFDADYGFYRGPMGFVPFVIPFTYLGVILYLTIRRYTDNRKKADLLILIACALLCLLSSVLDAVRGGVRLHSAIMISSIFFYVFLRSYDVRRDALTSVLNRQSMYDDCTALDRSICAAASLDMNSLKAMNDREGHQAGDTALKKIGESLRAAANRDRDVRAYRIGGDEFVLLFFRRDEDVIRKTLEKVCTEAEGAGYSIACGYALRDGGESPEALIARSDLKMFGNKAQYYRDQAHDRRRGRKGKTGMIPEETRRALEESPQPLAVYQFSNHRIEMLAVSDGFLKLFGYPDRDQAVHILDRDMYRSVHADDQERLSGSMLRFFEEEELDVVYRDRAGMEADYRVIHARGTHPHTGTDAQLAYVWYMDEGVYRDGEDAAGSLMTQALNRALHEESLVYASRYDALTGLPALAWFFTLYETKKTETSREGKQEVLLYIDLNGMKFFNHKYGFGEGDRLLKAFAALLEKTFGKESCCHVAADRFAAGTTEEGLEERLRTLIGEAEKINGGNSLPVRIGVYSGRVESVSPSFAYDRAKMACDSMRQSDISGFNYYRKEMRDAFRRRQYLVANIDRAIREKWIRVYYQPIVRAADGQVCDTEALARWLDPTEGFLSPADFIPYLEDAGLIYKLDLCVLDQVIEKIRAQQEAGVTVVPHSVNLSRSDFETCDIVEELRKRVDAAGIRHDLISVEITESVIASNFEYMNEQVNRFRENGFAVWMDDFGSGYSSLDVLQSIHFDLIKFDMSFTRKLDEGENGKIILTELMRLASRLKLDTICEGVEKEEHVSFLREIGCSKLQGYYFSRPVPYEQGAATEAGGTDAPARGENGGGSSRNAALNQQEANRRDRR